MFEAILAYNNAVLQRVLGFWALVAYGVGDILGAGIYALVGKVAGAAGTGCWIAFSVALGVAALTALSYAELGSRFPKSGGAAAFCQEAFRSPHISILIGWLVLCSGVVSMAAVSKAFAGYFHSIVPQAPQPWVVGFFLFGLGVLNFRGMKESSSANIFCTAVEVSGLLVVLAAGGWFLSALSRGPIPFHPSDVPEAAVSWERIVRGAALAFFAFVGFEDLVNVAEESKDPRRDLPKAIITAVLATGLLYLAIAWMAVRIVPPSELAVSNAPLLAVVKTAAPWIPAGLFSGVALFAVSNTALLNFIMGSRLLYGMAQEGLVPAWLGAVHARRHTPHRAIGVLLVIALVLALSGSLVFLAGATSALILTIFTIVNAALLAIKFRSEPTPGVFQIPWMIPALGVAASLGLGAFVPWESWVRAFTLIAAGIVLVAGRSLGRMPQEI